MNLEKRIAAFVELGLRLENLKTDEKETLFIQARNGNSWFDEKSVDQALKGIIHFLEYNTLHNWINSYELPQQSKTIGTVMAGNIPLVGFHDLLCVLITGNKLMVKFSSQDTVLMKMVINHLMDIEPDFSKYILEVDQLKGMDAIIATGSDNTARYFEYYFGKYPNIIRKNRSSCAIINGTENKDDLKLLGEDIFSYYGLGCRNVSKLYVPVNYDFKMLFESLEDYSRVINHHKYSNNYDYNKSIYLVNKEAHLDTGFMLVKKSQDFVSPISVIYYEEYADNNKLDRKLVEVERKIQCIVSSNRWYKGSFNFGKAQLPEVTDYADHVDTIEFLNSI